MKSSNPVYTTVQSIKVVHSTIAKDLEDINKKVKESSMNLRRERVRLIKVIYLSIYLYIYLLISSSPSMYLCI